MAFLIGYFVMLLWNWLMPGIFGVRMVTYWEGAGLVLLARLLIGTIGHHGGGHHGNKRYAMRKHQLEYWERYDQWWKSEGKDAFRSYVDRIDKEGNEQS